MKAATDDRTVIIGTNVISIHAAREGGDGNCRRCACKPVISIHAAREGGDLALNLQANALNYFNPRRP